MDPTNKAKEERPFKELFFAEKVNRVLEYVKLYSKQNRDEFRRDFKAVLCKGTTKRNIFLNYFDLKYSNLNSFYSVY
jgi:hypothetical protein